MSRKDLGYQAGARGLLHALPISAEWNLVEAAGGDQEESMCTPEGWWSWGLAELLDAGDKGESGGGGNGVDRRELRTEGSMVAAPRAGCMSASVPCV